MTAAAVPEGNLSFSRLIMFRFIGIASTVPSAACARTHAPRTPHGRCSPFGFASVADSMSSAEIAETTVPTVAEPAADAVDCMQFVSRIVIGDFATPTFRSTFQIPYARIAAVMATPRLHPVLSPT